MIAMSKWKKCPYCDVRIEDLKLATVKDNQSPLAILDHLIEKHEREFASALKAGPIVNKDGVYSS